MTRLDSVGFVSAESDAIDGETSRTSFLFSFILKVIACQWEVLRLLDQ